MKRAAATTIAAAVVFGCVAKAMASTSATIGASVSVVQAAGVQFLAPLVLPTISTTAVIPVSGLSGGGLTAVGNSLSPNAKSPGAAPLGNATLTIYGQGGGTVSMAVPESFQVVRTGGTETLTVKTTTNSAYSLGGNGVVLGGAENADTMSVNVGGALALASNDSVAPGPYAGMLVVVVQYN